MRVTSLDARARDWMRLCMHAGGPIARQLLDTLDFSVGSTYTRLAPEIPPDVAYDFRFERVRGMTEKDWAESLLAGVLRSEGTLVIGDSVSAHRGDGWLHSTPATVPWFSVDGKSLCFFLHGARDVAAEDVGSVMSYSTDARGLGCAFCLDRVFDFVVADGDVRSRDLPDLEPSVAVLCVEAYDGVGYVLWQRQQAGVDDLDPRS